MVLVKEETIQQLHASMAEIDEPLKKSFQNVHQGYPNETLARFLEARDGDVAKARRMLVDCLNWRAQNEIDSILSKPIVPSDLYRDLRDSHLTGISGYSKQGLPVICVGVGLSSFDKASVNYYVQSHIQVNEYRDRVVLPAASEKQGRYIGTCIKILDMTGLKLSSLNHIKLLTVLSTIDDLNYPEKTETYFIVNAPFIFSACWKVVRPLLQERTRNRVQVLSGNGRDELLKIMDYESLPHFCQKGAVDNCFSLDHSFHQQLYNYTIEKAGLVERGDSSVKQGSFHVKFSEPDADEAKIAQTVESTFRKFGSRNGICNSLRDVKINCKPE